MNRTEILELAGLCAQATNLLEVLAKIGGDKAPLKAVDDMTTLFQRIAALNAELTEFIGTDGEAFERAAASIPNATYQPSALFYLERFADGLLWRAAKALPKTTTVTETLVPSQPQYWSYIPSDAASLACLCSIELVAFNRDSLETQLRAEWVRAVPSAQGAPVEIPVDPFAIMHDEMKSKGATDREVAIQYLRTRSPIARKELIAKHEGEQETIRYLVKQCDNLRQRRRRASLTLN